MSLPELDEMIAALRKLGDTDKVCATIAVEGAAALKAALTQTLDAGTTPEGVPWAPRKGGGQAYANASAALQSQAFGPLIRVSITGPEAWGHYGTGRMPSRQMLPDAGSGIPASASKALQDAAITVFDRWTR